MIMRTVRRSAVVATLVFPAFAASSPELVPVAVREQWRQAAEVIPWISFSTLILGSVTVATHGYLAAVGRPGTVGWATAAFGVAWLAVTAPLLGPMGVAAVGVGNLSGSFVEIAILTVATRRCAGVSPYRPMVVPATVALLAGAVGWLACTAGSPGFVTAFAAAGLTLALSIAGLLLVCWRDLTDVLRLGAGTARNAITGLRRPSAEAPVLS